MKMEKMPSGESARELSGRRLPFFNHATEDEFKALFSNLRDNATLSSSFIVLITLSVMLAMLGLFANSSPVIIGAMILAPLMAPIVSLSMGLARADEKLMIRSLKTLGIGVSVAIFGAMVCTWFIPLETLTAEMKSRLTPTLLDLGVAVISGAAGAYAHARSELSKSLAGVSIAVALVPPLSVVGIGLGWLDFNMASGAMLLFLTNLIGIALASSVTFLFLGFSPFRLAKKGLGWNTILLMIISIPLMISFARLVDKENILHRVPQGEKVYSGVSLRLNPLNIKRTSNGPVLEYEIVAPTPADLDIIEELKKHVLETLEKDTLIEVNWVIRH
jgi:uncharacterized hydrophobic protein (TIGR00271 family)